MHSFNFIIRFDDARALAIVVGMTRVIRIMSRGGIGDGYKQMAIPVICCVGSARCVENQ